MKNTVLSFITVVFTLLSIGGMVTINSSTISNYLSFTAAKATSAPHSTDGSRRIWKNTGSLASDTSHFMLSNCTKGDEFVRASLGGNLGEYSDDTIVSVIRESNSLC
jgi:hypothetical protein